MRAVVLITLAAVSVLVVFFIAAYPHMDFTGNALNLAADAAGKPVEVQGGNGPWLPFGLTGVMLALPFAVYMFLAIEQLPLTAEESHNPTRHLPLALVWGTVILAVLALGVLFFSASIGGGSFFMSTSSEPLLDGFRELFGHTASKLLSAVAVLGLAASFLAGSFAAGRNIYSLSRAGYLPAMFAKVHPRFRTPVNALIGGGIVGIAAVFSDQWVTIGGLPLTANIVTMAVLGALVMYIMSMASLFKLRASEPKLDRPFRAPLYPLFPAIAIVCGLVCLVAVVYFNQLLSLIFLGLMGLGYAYFRLTAAQREAAPHDAMLAAAAE